MLFGAGTVEFVHKFVYNRACRLNRLDESSNLPDFEFALRQVSQEHTLFGASPSE